jgi:hypothetical protein
MDSQLLAPCPYASACLTGARQLYARSTRGMPRRFIDEAALFIRHTHLELFATHQSS